MILNNQLASTTGCMFERIKFERWASKQEYDLSKFTTNLDFSNMPAYKNQQTYDAWAGWMGKANFFEGA